MPAAPGAAQPGRAGPRARARGAARPCGRCRARAGAPQVLGRHGAAQGVRAVHGEHREGEPWPDAADRLDRLEHVPLVVVGEPEERERVLPHDERRRQRAASPTRRPARVAGVACTSSPTPPTSTTAASSRSAGDPRRAPTRSPRTSVPSLRARGAEHVYDRTLATAPLSARRGAPPPRPRAHARWAACRPHAASRPARARRARRRRAPQVADRQRERIGGVRGVRPRLQAEDPGDHGCTCALSARPLPVTAALTSLGVCSATGMPRRAAAAITTPDTCAVPITVRTLCCAKTRSTATASGRVPVQPLLDLRPDRAQPQRRVSPGATARPRPRRGARAARAARRRRRDRTGSGQGPLRARAPRQSPRRRPAPGTDPRPRAGDYAAGHAGRRCGHSSSSAAMTSSEASKLAKTFCTSSLSSSASIRRRILRAPSTSTSTWVAGTNCASAES